MEEIVRLWWWSVQLAGLLIVLFCSGGDEARRSGGCEGVTERIIPIGQATKGNAPVTDKAKVMSAVFKRKTNLVD